MWRANDRLPTKSRVCVQLNQRGGWTALDADIASDPVPR